MKKYQEFIEQFKGINTKRYGRMMDAAGNKYKTAASNMANDNEKGYEKNMKQAEKIVSVADESEANKKKYRKSRQSMSKFNINN